MHQNSSLQADPIYVYNSNDSKQQEEKNVRGDRTPLLNGHNHTPYKELNNMFAPVNINFLLVLTRWLCRSIGTPG